MQFKQKKSCQWSWMNLKFFQIWYMTHFAIKLSDLGTKRSYCFSNLQLIFIFSPRLTFPLIKQNKVILFYCTYNSIALLSNKVDYKKKQNSNLLRCFTCVLLTNFDLLLTHLSTIYVQHNTALQLRFQSYEIDWKMCGWS